MPLPRGFSEVVEKANGSIDWVAHHREESALVLCGEQCASLVKIGGYDGIELVFIDYIMEFRACYTGDGGGIDIADAVICPAELEAMEEDAFDGGSGGFGYVPEEDYVGRC